MTAPSTNTLADLLARWDSDEGRPYKGQLIDWDAYEADPDNLGCMCAQGQILRLYAGWEPEKLRDADQVEADAATAEQLNISRAHAVLLRDINDKVEGAPSIVLTDPGKVLGDQWSKLLDFWWMIDAYNQDDLRKLFTVQDAGGAAAGVAAGAAAGGAARDAAGGAARDAAGGAGGVAGGGAGGGAAWEIQGFELLGQRGRDAFFLPMFGIKTLDDIPPRPADYGNGLVPAGVA